MRWKVVEDRLARQGYSATLNRGRLMGAGPWTIGVGGVWLEELVFEEVVELGEDWRILLLSNGRGR
jgi:hypothetical protein